MAMVWLNGRLRDEAEAYLSPSDRGFTLADGVFETFRVFEGEAVWLADHLARLRQGAGVLGLPVPMSDDALAEGIAALIDASGLGDASLRLTVSRGPTTVRGLLPEIHPAPTVLATIAPLPPPKRAVTLIVAENTRRNEHSPLSRIKSLNYGDNLIARQEAARRGADDAVMLNTAGRVACTTVGNLFLRIEGGWVTPSLDEGILPGLARATLLEPLAAEERAIEAAELHEADAAIISNSLGLTSVAAVGETGYEVIDL